MATIVCPYCRTENPVGSAFCINCGKSLPTTEKLEAPTMAFHAEAVDTALKTKATTAPLPSTPKPESAPVTVALPRPGTMTLAMPDGSRLSLKGAMEYAVGRADPVNDWNPAIDLALHDGLALGVSRRHARFFFKEGEPFLEDLGSSNGSYLNDKELAPGATVQLHEGDKIMFGRLVVRFHL